MVDINSFKFLAVAFWAVESSAEFPSLDVLNSWKLPPIVTVCVQFSTDATCAGVYIPLVAVKLLYLPRVIVLVVLFLFFIVPTGTHTNWFPSVPFSITIPSCTAGILFPL